MRSLRQFGYGFTIRRIMLPQTHSMIQTDASFAANKH